MAKTTVRIDEATHALLSELAKADGVTLHEELARAVMARRKERFFEEMEAGYVRCPPRNEPRMPQKRRFGPEPSETESKNEALSIAFG